MSGTSSIPTPQASQALLQPTKFQVQFVRLPSVVYFCHEIILPGGEVKNVEQLTPFKNRMVAGHKLEYDTLSITFVVEQEMYSWEGIHNWLKDIGTETGFQDYNNLRQFPGQTFPLNELSYPNAYCDATLTILDVNNNPQIRFQFHDCFPMKLGPITMNTEAAATDVIKCTATFGFFYYEVDRIGLT